jgi:HK97 family phage prohead protease
MAQEKRALRFSVRAVDAGEEFALSGRAISYNDETEIPCGNGESFIERVAPGALDEVLGSDAEVKALFNHNVDSVLGSRKNKTLSLKSNERGLYFGIQLDKNNAKHQEVHAMCKRGDVDGCSFGFFPEDEDWDQVRDANGNVRVRRTLKKIKMHEMSVVTFPAYTNTLVQARSVNYTAQIARAKTVAPALRPDAFFAQAKKRAQEIKEEIFRTADAFTINEQTWEVTPHFYTEAEREAALTRQLREKCDEIGRQIFKDDVRAEFGL